MGASVYFTYNNYLDALVEAYNAWKDNKPVITHNITTKSEFKQFFYDLGFSEVKIRKWIDPVGTDTWDVSPYNSPSIQYSSTNPFIEISTGVAVDLYVEIPDLYHSIKFKTKTGSSNMVRISDGKFTLGGEAQNPAADYNYYVVEVNLQYNPLALYRFKTGSTSEFQDSEPYFKTLGVKTNEIEIKTIPGNDRIIPTVNPSIINEPYSFTDFKYYNVVNYGINNKGLSGMGNPSAYRTLPFEYKLKGKWLNSSNTGPLHFNFYDMVPIIVYETGGTNTYSLNGSSLATRYNGKFHTYILDDTAILVRYTRRANSISRHWIYNTNTWIGPYWYYNKLAIGYIFSYGVSDNHPEETVKMAIQVTMADSVQQYSPVAQNWTTVPFDDVKRTIWTTESSFTRNAYCWATGDFSTWGMNYGNCLALGKNATKSNNYEGLSTRWEAEITWRNFPHFTNKIASDFLQNLTLTVNPISNTNDVYVSSIGAAEEKQIQIAGGSWIPIRFSPAYMKAHFSISNLIPGSFSSGNYTILPGNCNMITSSWQNLYEPSYYAHEVDVGDATPHYFYFNNEGSTFYAGLSASGAVSYYGYKVDMSDVYVNGDNTNDYEALVIWTTRYKWE